jgi:precorrin-2 dehydrogenase / sirohydrochlorin ferrochelatase
VPVDEPTYPVNLLLAGRRVLVVGGGAVAAQKIRGLLDARAEVHVVARQVGEEVRALPVTWEERPYRRGEVAGYRLVTACTDDPAVNRAVFEDGEEAGVLVNAADDPANCSCILPARVRQGRLLVTISTAGHSPAMASWLRERLSAELGPEYDVLIDLLAEQREAGRAAGSSPAAMDWRSVLDSGMLELVREGRVSEARARLSAGLGQPPSG